MRIMCRQTRLLFTVGVVQAGLIFLADNLSATLVIPPPSATTEWVGPPQDPGSWFDSRNWSGGVPNETDVAELKNGGIIKLRRGRAETDVLRLTGPRLPTLVPSSQFRQKGGRLRIHQQLSIDDGVYFLDRGTLSTDWMTLGRPPLPILGIPLPVPRDDDRLESPLGLPLPTQLEETIAIDITPIDSLELLSRGKLQQFHQSGGRTRIDRRLSIYSGGARISGGRLEAESVLIDVNLFLGVTGTPGVEQSGGVVRVTDELLLQDNWYRLSGGTLRVDRIAIGDPAMESPLVSRFNRLPEFIQTGGVNHVTGNLELCVPGFIGGGPTIELIQLFPFQSANYRLEEGRLKVDGDTIVGSLGEAPVNFIHSAGTARIGGTLRIEGATSRYDFSGGRLITENLEIGMGVFNSGGSFAFSEPAQVTVKNRISLGEESVFAAVPGSRLRLTGEKFENFSTDDDNLAGLNNLELTVGGSNWNLFRSSNSQVTDFEVGGIDLGDVDEGYVENFALDTLRVGGLSSAHLKLVDLVDNQPDSESPEALYVDHLYVGRGSTLELGGVPIYYRTAQILGSVINSSLTLASIGHVPEPTSAILLVAGVLIVARSRMPRR